MDTTRVCRLCKSVISSKRAVALFSGTGIKERLAARISQLADVPEPSPNDHLPSCICAKCKAKISFLEKAAVELSKFRLMARPSENRGLKRTKETSGVIGVSPDTIRQRPRSKQMRKRLTFTTPAASVSVLSSISEPDSAQDLVSLQVMDSTLKPANPQMPCIATPQVLSGPALHQMSWQSQESGIRVDESGVEVRVDDTCVAVSDGEVHHSRVGSARPSPSALEGADETQGRGRAQVRVTGLLNCNPADGSRSSPMAPPETSLTVDTSGLEASPLAVGGSARPEEPSLAISESARLEEISSAMEATSSGKPVQRSQAITVTVTVGTPSHTLYCGQLKGAEGKLARTLLGENASSVANAALAIDSVKEAIIKVLLGNMEEECRKLCRKKPTCTLFRKYPVDKLAEFKWVDLIDELKRDAPLLLGIISSLVSHSDRRNKTKVGAAHHPGICSTVAVLLKERNREMCGLQSQISLLMYSCHCEKQVYARLNHLNMCASYSETLDLMDEVSKLHTVPIQKWIQEGTIFKFWGDNVNKQRRVRDYRSDHHGEMVNMYSILAGRSRTPAPHLAHTGSLSDLTDVSVESFLPQRRDIFAIKSNLVVLVSRILVQYFPALKFLSGVVAKHIRHKYSTEMAKKSEVVVLDMLLKNETEHKDMLDIMHTMQDYLGDGYPQERRVLSGGDHLTCERQIGAQRHMMDGNTQQERLEILEPVVEDWHCQLCIITMMWKTLYGKSVSDHGTLAFFRNLLRRTAVTSDPKKDVNACIDLIITVMKGHILQAACDILKVDGLESQPSIPVGLQQASKSEKLAFICDIAQEVVERCTLVEEAYSWKPSDTSDDRDGMYNYTRVFCHFGALLMEYRDSWGEGDGERNLRVWKLLMPHFKAAGHTKYALQALRLQIQLVTLSPNLSHQVLWNRFVNVRGGLGRNIPCDLHNEHINKLLKHIIVNMGSNFKEGALQRAARSVTALSAIEENFDSQSGVSYHTSAHSTKPDIKDVEKVMATVKKHKLLDKVGIREHPSFPGFSWNPLAKWNLESTKAWMEEKKREYLKYKGRFRANVEAAQLEGISIEDILGD